MGKILLHHKMLDVRAMKETGNFLDSKERWGKLQRLGSLGEEVCRVKGGLGSRRLGSPSWLGSVPREVQSTGLPQGSPAAGAG